MNGYFLHRNYYCALGYCKLNYTLDMCGYIMYTCEFTKSFVLDYNNMIITEPNTANIHPGQNVNYCESIATDEFARNAKQYCW